MWIQKTLIHTTIASSAMIALVIIPLALSSRWIVTAWVGADMVADSSLIAWLTKYTISASLATPFAIFLQGYQRARTIAIVTVFNGVFTIITIVILVKALGAYGMAIAMTMAYVLISLPVCVVQSKREFR